MSKRERVAVELGEPELALLDAYRSSVGDGIGREAALCRILVVHLADGCDPDIRPARLVRRCAYCGCHARAEDVEHDTCPSGKRYGYMGKAEDINVPIPEAPVDRVTARAELADPVVAELDSRTRVAWVRYRSDAGEGSPCTMDDADSNHSRWSAVHVVAGHGENRGRPLVLLACGRDAPSDEDVWGGYRYDSREGFEAREFWGKRSRKNPSGTRRLRFCKRCEKKGGAK